MRYDSDQFMAVLSKFVHRSAYTPGQLASLTGVPKMTLVNWLNGRVKRPRDWPRIVAVAAALRLTEAEANQLLAAAQQSPVQELRQQAATAKEQEMLAFWQTETPFPPVPDPPFQVIPLSPYFVGREQERAALVEALKQERQTAVYCLYGMAGVGKTSLAAQVAYGLRQHFTDGVLWARLDSSDTMSILAAFAEAYQRDVSSCLDVASRSGVVRNLLSNRRVLMVLDNAQTSEQIEPLLPPTGQCAVLVTTRRQDLAVLVGAKRLEIRPFAPHATTSLILFTRILGQERVQAEAELLTQIAADLGHLPLALVIAASRLAYEPGWHTAEFSQRVHKTSQRLRALQYETKSIRLSFQLSYDLLDPPAQQLFATAGWLGRQDFAAETLAALTELDEETVADGLRQLFSLSLVQGGVDGRYSLHPLLHDFAQSLSEKEAVAERLIDYWTAFLAAHQYAPTIVTRELGHIQVALQVAIQGKLIQAVRLMLDALMPTVITRGVHSLVEPYLTQVQTLVEAAQDRVGQSWVWLQLGYLERERHHLAMAESYLQTGLRLARQQQDAALEAQLLTNLGIVYNCWGQFEKGKAFLLEALPLARATAETTSDTLLGALEELGGLAIMAGDKAEAERYYQEGLSLSQIQQNRAQNILFLKSLGTLYHLGGEASQAEAFLKQGYALAQQLQFHKGVMLLANNLAVIMFGKDDMERTEVLLQTALKEAERLDEDNALMVINLNLAYWARHNGRLSHAYTYFSRVLSLAKAQNQTELAHKIQAQRDSVPPSTEHIRLFI